jgi:hypothetical protein
MREERQAIGSEKNDRFCDSDERSKTVRSWMREKRKKAANE